MKNFFKREHSEQYFDTYVPSIKDKFNYQNIETSNKYKVMSCFHYGQEKDFLAYRFDVLSEWMKVNERYQQTFIDRLNRVIDILCLREEFNSFEQQKIIEIEGIIFAKWRNLKQQIVDFPLYDNEFVFYRYEIDSFGKPNERYSSKTEDLVLFITTKRIVISQHLYTISLDYEAIANYKVSKFGIIFNMKNGNSYEVKCDNVYAIYVSLERVLKREQIIFN